ncbi:hypothetical protein FE634_04040 [Nocardioides dongxiaopingii]|uniref:hypothetical protein n=1 Tax=Nocardioides sp. S-1144 TaxID=2582905 RepID=UPI00110F021B|nr:hypothetical protein [Nocardioides sp. S-1144]QCW49785.1 hypothetical protein FE634_04040 [Nocardioides sp. S-1144]
MRLIGRIALVGCGLLFGASALLGCSSDETSTPAAAQVVDAKPVIALNSESNGWPAALISGSLVEREGCLLIGNQVAVFPFGTTRDASGTEFPDGTRVAVPSEVRMTGGHYDDLTLIQSDLPVVPMAEVKTCAGATGATGFVWAMPS